MSGDQRVFRVPKGVSTVDYCHKNNALVTGSTDQIIRIWNPFINTYVCFTCHVIRSSGYGTHLLTRMYVLQCHVYM